LTWWLTAWWYWPPQKTAAGEFISRLTDSVETALRMSEGQVTADLGEGNEIALSDQNACPGLRDQFP